ncbi:Hypothetical protein R9X50_00349100 [Acrodontium crateriforme]|uniref:FAD-binding PCMH-type domain-containing protein n=1 Tax=Acrodontium crateriforme TaxID=150365 RepID=A0AAQ3R9G1_9PEZI|nr:Hypothetical protein R9X50_00349100 [Acrodontium crateriforme]
MMRQFATAAALFCAHALATIDSFAYLDTCSEIQSVISSASRVDYLLDLAYLPAINHWYESSSEASACVLNAGSTEDVAAAIKIIGNRQVPFAIKSGGHATNPGFSSTPGVHIWFDKYKSVTLSSDKQTALVGAGAIFSDVYNALDGTGVTINGGRVPGPGVGGFTLGGGFSWWTNQYGLTCDTVKSFTLVAPNGTIIHVDSSKPDLFFALKGAGNRMGIVTEFEYYTHLQGDVYGGLILLPQDDIVSLVEDTKVFAQQNKDPKVQIINVLDVTILGISSQLLVFHDAPYEPDSLKPFDKYHDAFINDVKVQSVSSFVSAIPAVLGGSLRGTFNTISVTNLTSTYLDAVYAEAQAVQKIIGLHGGRDFRFEIEPFLPTHGQHATDSAYAHADSPLPLNLDVSWSNPLDDEFWIDYTDGVVARLRQLAQSENILSPQTYSNYAATGTSADQLFGVENAARVRKIRDEIDPNNVMDLAGGFNLH